MKHVFVFGGAAPQRQVEQNLKSLMVAGSLGLNPTLILLPEAAHRLDFTKDASSSVLWLKDPDIFGLTNLYYVKYSATQLATQLAIQLAAHNQHTIPEINSEFSAKKHVYEILPLWQALPNERAIQPLLLGAQVCWCV